MPITKTDEPSASPPQDVRTTLMNGTSRTAINATLNTVIAATGNKGGTGKSTAARALIDILTELNVAPEIIEADGGNSDVGKFYGLKENYNLNTSAGFANLFRHIETSATDKPMVISLPSGADEKAEEHSAAFFSALQILGETSGRDIRMLWVIDDKRDCVESLNNFRKLYPRLPIDVLRNNFFAASDEFEFFNNSKLRAAIGANGGRTIDFPALPKRLARRIMLERLTYAKAQTAFGILDRLDLEAWWAKVRSAFIDAGFFR